MPPVIGNGVSGLFGGTKVNIRTEDLGMLGEEREFVKVMTREIKELRGPLYLRLRSRLLAHGRAGEKERPAGRSQGHGFVEMMMWGHTSIGWHASPRSTTRPFGWTQLGSGLRSMRRHFSVDLTNDTSFWTLCTGSWIFCPQKRYVPWLEIRKVGAHLVSTAFFRPRLDGPIVWVDQHHVVFLLCSLARIKIYVLRRCARRKRKAKDTLGKERVAIIYSRYNKPRNDGGAPATPSSLASRQMGGVRDPQASDQYL